MSDNEDSGELGFIIIIVGIVLLITFPPAIPVLLMIRFILKIFNIKNF